MNMENTVFEIKGSELVEILQGSKIEISSMSHIVSEIVKKHSAEKGFEEKVAAEMQRMLGVY